MKAERAQLIKDIFAEASDRHGVEREEFLAERCANDPEIRAAVERLLLADEDIPRNFLDGQLIVPLEVPAPSRIGNFRVLRKIASGGMGSVFEAEQEHPRRRVALKVVRMSMATESIRRRFEHEVEILGRLKHPGIAQIYEAGTYGDGADVMPYFAMEFVDGQPLLDFARAQGLSIREKLNVMASICDAVHHAHLNGVVHRDLKPANILVERLDSGVHQPKVLDFGVARATHCDVQVATMHTEAGQLIGTLAYMSPEQVAGRVDDVDVRSDIYTLGVMLFELLSNHLPYDLRNRSMVDAGSVIQEQDATRLSSFDPAFRGDLETIVAKALSKERERRYASAAEFAADLRRFLADEPIVARPASRAYQLRKFARRNKALVGGVATAFVILIVAVIGISLALLRATRAEQVALQRLDESRRAEAKASAVSKFLTDMLSSVDPAKTLGREVTIRQALDDAAATINSGSLSAQPEVEAELRTAIGTTYIALGHYDEAEPHLEHALDIRRRPAVDDSGLVESLSVLSDLRGAQGRFAEAEALAREALSLCRQPSFDRLNLAAVVLKLAAMLRAQKHYDDAVPLYQEALAIRRDILGEDHPDVAQSLNSLALVHQDRGNLEDAESLFREALAIRRRALGDKHPVVAGGINNLAMLLQMRGNSAEAETLLREALAMRREIFGSEHPDVAQALNNLALLLYQSGKPAQAEPLFREALTIWRGKLPERHPNIGNAASGLGLVLLARGAAAEAEPLLHESFLCRETEYPEGHWMRFSSMSSWGESLAAQGKFAEAEPLLLEAGKRLKAIPDVAVKRKRQAFERLVQLYEAWKKPEQAATWKNELAQLPVEE